MTDYGPLQQFEITWAATGHVERIGAHQVSWPGNGRDLMAGLFNPVGVKPDVVRYVHFHGEIDGKWRLILSAREDDLRTIRNITAGESVPGGGAS